jgi:hypothetical protein
MFKENKIPTLFCGDEMLNNYKEECRANYEKSNPLKIERVSNGIVHPLQLSGVGKIENNEFGGVTDEKLKFIDLSLTKRVSRSNLTTNFHDWYKGANLDCHVSDIDYINEDVVFLGALSKHYGHFILEGLSRLWFCLEPESTSYKYVYISGDGKDRFNDFFKLFGLEEESIIKIRKPTRFRTVIVPEQSIRLHDFYHKKYKETIDRIKNNIKPAKFKKVYFSKARVKNNRAVGEASIEEVFLKNGFNVFCPETLSVYETISILKGCKVFAATSATNVHNSIFMNDENTFICLNRSAHFHPIQTMIEEMRSLKGIYVDVFIFSSDRNFGDAPCLLAPTKYLLDFFKTYDFTFNKSKLYLKFPLHMFSFIVAMPQNFIHKRIYSVFLKMKSSKYSTVRFIATWIKILALFGKKK